MNQFSRRLMFAVSALLSTVVVNQAMAAEPAKSISTNGASANAVTARIKAEVERYSNGTIPVTSVSETPIKGLYVVTSGADVFYVDSSGRYAMLDAQMVDMQTKKNITAATIEEASKIDFKLLPLELAVKTVTGNGRRVVAVFEDPTCVVCKSFHKFLYQLPDLTIYSFPYPVVTPEARPITAAAWCSANRADTWRSLMNGIVPSGTVQSTCDTSGLDRLLVIGEQLQIERTPTVFFSDGRRFVGATPPDQFVQALDSLNTNIKGAK